MGPTRPTYPEELMFVERASGEAEPATGSHRGGWREALLAGVRRALQTGGETAAASAWDPDEVLERELAQNSQLGGASRPRRRGGRGTAAALLLRLGRARGRWRARGVLPPRGGLPRRDRAGRRQRPHGADDARAGGARRMGRGDGGAGHDTSGCPFSGWTATTKAGRT